MGDRANIVIYDGTWPKDAHPKEAVFLYTHWKGSDVPNLLRNGLQFAITEGRADDSVYLARILFCALVKGHEADSTGFGISTRLTDNDNPLYVVDVARGGVVEYPEAEYERGGFATLSNFPLVKFDEYIKPTKVRTSRQ